MQTQHTVGADEWIPACARTTTSDVARCFSAFSLQLSVCDYSNGIEFPSVYLPVIYQSGIAL
ncbi:hypothetical protein QX220_07625 [Vibrio vulnificus]|uniref:hypothetical protein n=1 Tax=Vibrio vulnificus TaxID=672 RepID=UPI00287A4E2D|nr:hypothetical protein [Vibrio vulnificus]MDS1861512.1 hypothetical protein [Vibrio vulnificus]HAV6897011.1 hypothetical protein [Vibrio vulnificus]HDY7436253.1 hypothetical protein [Vibrio vulnificus]